MANWWEEGATLVADPSQDSAGDDWWRQGAEPVDTAGALSPLSPDQYDTIPKGSLYLASGNRWKRKQKGLDADTELPFEERPVSNIASNVLTPGEQVAQATDLFRGAVRRGNVAALDEGTPEYIAKRLPFLGTIPTATELLQVRGAASRIKAGDFTDADVATIGQFLAKQEHEGDKGAGQKIVDLVTNLPAFGVEFAATGGMYSGGKQAATQGIKKLLGEAAERSSAKLATGVLSRGAGVAAQTAVNPQTVRSVLEKSLPEMTQQADAAGNLASVQIGDDVSFLQALPKGYLDAMIELGSERAGGKIGEVLGVLPGAAKVRALKQAIANRWIGAQPGRTYQALQTVLDKAGWNGVVNEVLEERVGDVARLGTGLESPRENVTGQLATGDFKPAVEQLLIEGAAFAIPGAAKNLASAALDRRQRLSTAHAAPPATTPTAPAGELADRLDELARQRRAEPPPATGASLEGLEEAGQEAQPEATSTDTVSVTPETQNTGRPPGATAAEPEAQAEAPSPAPAPETPVKKKRLFEKKQPSVWTSIGTNAEGNEIFEDQRGVRSYLTPDGIRITESVGVSPTGISVKRPATPEFEPAQPPAQEPANASPVRSDQGQTGQEGTVPQGSEVARGEDLQQPAPGEPGGTALGQPEAQEANRPEEAAAYAVASSPAARIAERVKTQLDGGNEIPEDRFFSGIADIEFGGTRAQGKYGDSQAYDALELGVNKHLLDRTDPTVNAGGAKQQVASIEAMSAKVPRHKTRTGQKDTLQQFSTPPAYAYVANWVANLRPSDTVLEPSAGTGGLAVHALNSKAAVYANEIDKGRGALVGELPVAKVFNEDAVHIAGILKGKMPQPTAVVMNPPFSRAGNRLGNKMVVGMDLTHIDAALNLMEPGGRLVAIVGAGLHGRGKGFERWLADSPYDVRADVEVGRDVYKGHGTTFPTRLLVIDKRVRTGKPLTGKADTLPELIDLLEGIRNDREIQQSGASAAQQQPAEPTGKKRLGKSEGGRGPAVSVQPPVGPVGAQPEAASPAPSPEAVRVGGSPAGSRDAGLEAGAASGVPAEPGPGAKPGGRGKRLGGKTPGRGPGDAGSGTGAEPVGESAKTDAQSEAPQRPVGVAVPQKAEATDTVSVTQDAGQEAGTEAPEIEQRVRTKKKQLEESTYEPYEPRVQFKGAKAHPASLVESAAMAAIDPPAITYSPKIPAKVIAGYTAEDGTKVGISDVQLEAVAMAGQAHAQMLPSGERRGFMIGDGTGVGKAREATGIMLDNWNQGRRKAVWVSKNSTLLDPAKDEWKKVGGDPTKLFAHSKVKSGEDLKAGEGILFTTYSTLRSEASEEAVAAGRAKSRVEQIVDWVGPDFDGVLVFDESHGMASGMDRGSGRSKKKAAAQALAGIDLQNRLPNARVVYLSATSATEVENLAYATRLGLWGEGTAFSDRAKFMDAIGSGGVAAMEKVAADMKAMGMYIARNIAFNDGTEKGTVQYERLEHTLTPDQHRAYDKMAEAWGIVFQNMNEALELTEGNKSGNAVGKARGAFWSANQRFFNQVITAMQTASVIRSIEKDLSEGRSAVVQLTNTNEASDKRAMAELDEDDDLDSLDISPRQILMDYLDRSFPTTMFESFIDDNGNERMRPVKDSDGNFVKDPRALAMKEQLLDELGSLQVASRGAMDMIIDHFGTDMVSEVTGRSERLAKVEGKMTRQKRSPSARKADINAFMDGKKRVLIFSEAGGTGSSYHADNTRKNQEPRQHYLLQAGWKADTAIQGLGRSHRSNQAQAPKYVLVHTNLKGQKRFISTIARRLAQLGALTKGSRQAGDSGVFSAADNLESTEAREALRVFYRDAMGNAIPGVDLNYLENVLGLTLRDSDGNVLAELPPITQFMNRVLSTPVEQQNKIFDEFQKRLEAKVEQAIANGTLDQGLETVKADKIQKVNEQVVYTHPTGAQAKHVVVNIFRKTKPMTWERAQNSRVIGYVQSEASDKVFTIEDTGVFEQSLGGDMLKKLRLVGPMTIQYSDDRKIGGHNWKRLSEKEAEKLWNEQVATAPKMSEQEMHLLSGVLLPVWDRLPQGTNQVKRLLTDEGEQILGRVIPEDKVQTVLSKLGASAAAPKMSPAKAVEAVLAGKQLTLANDWKIKRSRVDGETTIEIIGPDYSHNRELERQGVFSRRVAYKTRYFIPTGDEAESVMAAVLKDRPIAGVGGVTDTMSVNEPAGKSQVTQVSQPATSTRQTRSTDATHSTREIEETSAADILKTWERMFGVPLRVGGFRSSKAAGIYKVMPEVVRLKEPHIANLAVASHEIAHHLDKVTAGVASVPSAILNELRGLDYEPKNRATEGWAEFVRHFITEQDAQQVAPQVYEWFTKTWMPAHPSYARAIKEAQQHARDYADQSVFQRVRSAIGRPGDDLSWSERWKRDTRSWGRWMMRTFVDRLSPLKAIQEEAAKRGADYSEKAGVYDTAMAYDMSSHAMAAQALENGVHALSDGRKLSDGLWDVPVRELRNDVEREEAVAYAWARHALFVHDKNPRFNTGMDVEDARSMVEYVESDPDKRGRYLKVAKGIADYANGTLDMLVDAGALSPKDRNRMVEYYGDFYFPLVRAKEGATQNAGGGRFVNLPRSVKGRSFRGSGRPIMDPYDAMVSLTLTRYAQAAKTRVAHALAMTLDPRLGGVEGMGGVMDRIDPKRKLTSGVIENILGRLVEEGVVEEEDAKAMRVARDILAGEPISEASRKFFAARHGLPDTVSVDDLAEYAEKEPDVTAVIGLWKDDYTPNAAKATVVIRDTNGDPLLYEMDRELYDTAMGMQDLQFVPFLNILREASRFFKAGAVGASTGFGTANLMRDYFEYQGRAEHVKGAASLGKPVEMVGRYIAYKAKQLAGQQTDDALIETFEAAGGKLFSQLGTDIGSRQRFRKRKLGQEKGTLSPWHIKDMLYSGLDNLQDVIAWTDAPPRLAEMEAAAKELGYTTKGKDWVDKNGQVVNLPEHARIKMLNAAAEATINFKRVGSARWIDAFLPFANATIQAKYREAKQVASLRKLGDLKSAEGQKALRYLIYLASMASVGALVWYLRHDDDDYREQEPWLKDGYWTWGKNGTTYLKIPKPRDAGGLVASLMEASLDAAHHDDSQKAIGDMLGRYTVNQLPTGGGPTRAAVEALVADYDYFRDRPLTPDYLKDDPKALQYTPYTLETSKVLGRITAPALDISPIQAEHLLNGSSGGAYRRLGDTAEAAYEGRLGPEHVPFVRGLAMNRFQARSIDDFYTEWNRIKLEAKWQEANKGVTPETQAQKDRLDDYAALLTQIRKSETRDLKGRRKFDYEPYLVALAREALNREPLEGSRSPFTEENLPEPVRQAIKDFSLGKAERAILSHGMPQKPHEGDKDLAESIEKWEQGQKSDTAWLMEHQGSPVVQEALSEIKASKSYKDLLAKKGRPSYLQGKETYDEHISDLNRWLRKVETARGWQ